MTSTTTDNTTVPSVESIVLQLFEIGAVKFGEFTLKSGITSPIYIDLRVIVSHPLLLQQVSELIWSKICNVKFDILCGVPYTALPIATSISLQHSKAMVMRRKEAKSYGTKKIIEGQFNKNSKCIIIEDLVTSGTSVLETLKVLNDVGLNVTDVAVLIDRQQGGKQNLLNNNLNLHSCYTINEMLDILFKHNKIDQDIINRVQEFLSQNNSVKPKLEENKNVANGSASAAGLDSKTEEKGDDRETFQRLSYLERSKLCTNSVSKKLLTIMTQKETNLCVAGDVSTCDELLKLADAVGPYICMLKTHIDVLTDFNHEFINKLINIATKHNFILFEDRKFADIGNTVMKQFGEGIYKISSWADIINAHCIPGPGIIEGLKKVSMNGDKNGENINCINHGLLLLAEMSSKGNLATNDYTKTSIEWAKEYKNFVIGFISRRQLIKDPIFIHMTPGVNLNVKGDSIGQQYLTPNKVIADNGSDIIIVGRGVYKADNPANAAKAYRDAGWSAYIEAMK